MRKSEDSALKPMMASSMGTELPQHDSQSPGTPPAVDDGQLLQRGKTFPKARRDEEMELPGMLERCVKLISGVKKVVAEMRESVKLVVSHREKCSMILSAAMAASVALDQALYTGNLGLANEKELQMLCTEVSSALALGETRIRVYGLQPRWKKYMKQISGRRTEAKFDEVVQRLTLLTQQVWALQEGPNASSTSRFDLARMTRTPRSRGAFSGSPWSPKSSMPDSPAMLQQDTNPQVLLSRTRLRRGGQRNCVWSLLYIPPERSSGAKAALGQVWWYVGGCFPQLAVHDLAKNETKSVKTNRNMPGITVMAQDITGNVWTGHRDGYVRVWGEASHNPVCAPYRAMHSDITCITMDDSGCVWLGSASGDVRAVALAVQKQPHGGLSKRIEARTTLKWGGPGSAPGSAQDTPAARTPSLTSLTSLASSWTTFGQRAAGVTPEAMRAHGGPLLAIAAQGGRVWTSGSDRHAATLREWSAQGHLSSSVLLGAFGAASAIMTMPRYVNVIRQDSGTRASPERQAQEGGTSPDRAQVQSNAPQPATRQNSGKGIDSLWQLMTAHNCGRCQLWDISRGQLQPIAVLGTQTHPAKALLLCEEIGLWGTAHTDGTIILRLLPTGAAEERHTLTLDPDGPVPALNIPHFRAPFCAHRGGLAHAVGSGASIVTASVYGSVIMWPEAELRSVAEAVGFVLPTRSRAAQGDGHRISISQARPTFLASPVLQRYFTPHSAAMAEYALASAVVHRVKSHRAGTAEGSRLSPVQSLGDREGEEAQIIIEEVANLLRSSTSSTNDPAGPGSNTRAASLASDLTSSLQSTQGRALTAPPAGPSSGHELCLPGLFEQHLPHAATEPPPQAEGEAMRADPMAEAAYDIRHSPSAPNMAEEYGSGQELQSLAGSLKSNSLGTWPQVAFSPNWIIPYSELTLKKKIGEGSIGRVHLGRWQETDVAIKVLNSLSSIGVAAAEGAADGSTPDSAQDKAENREATESALADDSTRLATLEREVNIMAALRHPNVVLFMGVCLEPPCVVSEWCARGSLFDVLIKARSTPALAPQLDWARRLNMALDAAKGMLQLHTRQIIHRDLKSPNLLVDKHWRVKVCDFNLSRVESSAQDKTSSISANNPRWLAPEVISSRAFSKAADVFSFGVVLWELATWQLPWEELSIMVSVSEKGQRPDIPAQPQGGTFEGWAAYVDLIERCWAADPAQRPSFEGAITDLRELLTETAMLSRQRRIEAPISEAGNPIHSAKFPGAAQILQAEPLQPQAGPRTVSLGQVHGLAVAAPDTDGRRSDASPSGFTVPLHGSEDGSQRSSRRLSAASDRRFSADQRRSKSSSFEAADPLRRALQEGARMNAANLHILHLLSPGPGVASTAQQNPTGSGDGPVSCPEPAPPHPVRRIIGGNDGDADPQGAEKAADAAASGAMASPFGEPQQQTKEDGPESARDVRERGEGPVEGAHSSGWSDALCGPKLSKVDEVQSSMERGSDSESDGNLTMDSQGRQGKTSVLEGIHEQERSQQSSSGGSRSWASASSGSAAAQRAPSNSPPNGEQQPPSSSSSPSHRDPTAGLPGGEDAPGRRPAEPATNSPAGSQDRPHGEENAAAAAARTSAAELQQLTPFAAAIQAATGSGASGSGAEWPSPADSGGAEASGEQPRGQEPQHRRGLLGKVWALGKKALAVPLAAGSFGRSKQ